MRGVLNVVGATMVAAPFTLTHPSRLSRFKDLGDIVSVVKAEQNIQNPVERVRMAYDEVWKTSLRNVPRLAGAMQQYNSNVVREEVELLGKAVQALRDSLDGGFINPTLGMGNGVSLTIAHLKDGREVKAAFSAGPRDTYIRAGMAIGIETVPGSGKYYYIGNFDFSQGVSWDTTNTMANAIKQNVKLLRLKELKDGTFILEVAYKDGENHKFDIWVRRKDGFRYVSYLKMEKIEKVIREKGLPPFNPHILSALDLEENKLYWMFISPGLYGGVVRVDEDAVRGKTDADVMRVRIGRAFEDPIEKDDGVLIVSDIPH